MIKKILKNDLLIGAFAAVAGSGSRIMNDVPDIDTLGLLMLVGGVAGVGLTASKSGMARRNTYSIALGIAAGMVLTYVTVNKLDLKPQPHACRNTEIVKMGDGQTATIKAPAGCTIKFIP